MKMSTNIPNLKASVSSIKRNERNYLKNTKIEKNSMRSRFSRLPIRVQDLLFTSIFSWDEKIYKESCKFFYKLNKNHPNLTTNELFDFINKEYKEMFRKIELNLQNSFNYILYSEKILSENEYNLITDFLQKLDDSLTDYELSLDDELDDEFKFTEVKNMNVVKCVIGKWFENLLTTKINDIITNMECEHEEKKCVKDFLYEVPMYVKNFYIEFNAVKNNQNNKIVLH